MTKKEKRTEFGLIIIPQIFRKPSIFSLVTIDSTPKLLLSVIDF
jgi:hypothetical protein